MISHIYSPLLAFTLVCSGSGTLDDTQILDFAANMVTLTVLSGSTIVPRVDDVIDALNEQLPQLIHTHAEERIRNALALKYIPAWLHNAIVSVSAEADYGSAEGSIVDDLLMDVLGSKFGQYKAEEEMRVYQDRTESWLTACVEPLIVWENTSVEWRSEPYPPCFSFRDHKSGVPMWSLSPLAFRDVLQREYNLQREKLVYALDQAAEVTDREFWNRFLDDLP